MHKLQSLSTADKTDSRVRFRDRPPALAHPDDVVAVFLGNADGAGVYRIHHVPVELHTREKRFLLNWAAIRPELNQKKRRCDESGRPGSGWKWARERTCRFRLGGCSARLGLEKRRNAFNRVVFGSNVDQRKTRRFTQPAGLFRTESEET